ncbi:proteasome accessory factor PafA2 family protein [Arthrobacter sp. JCM 19049]|uniref:proteasome accessory factor PafA2 family protein n=1 Tax=Arthrobacter sp. JCM 19049 TaxID=1460643 RepID=UPI0006D25E78|nr:proteasome accessory factor PafA2 family protein [Arthrobacter sp. JCM 19049]
MSARRLVGLETEYGVIRPGMPKANATVLSAQIVDGYAQLVRHGDAARRAARWDYSDEPRCVMRAATPSAASRPTPAS